MAGNLLFVKGERKWRAWYSGSEAIRQVCAILSPMEFDLTGEHAKYSYKLLAGLVVPRPIAWVTTINEEGVVNAAPYQFF